LAWDCLTWEPLKPEMVRFVTECVCGTEIIIYLNTIKRCPQCNRYWEAKSVVQEVHVESRDDTNRPRRPHRPNQ
jgi:hypothetical protein